MLRVLLSVLCLCFIFGQPVSAELQKWQDPDFDFKKVKAVLVVAPYCEAQINDEILIEQLRQSYFKNVKIKKVKILYEKDIIGAVNAQTGQDMQVLAEDDAVAAYSLFEEEAKKQANIAIIGCITQYAKGSRHIREYTIQKTEYEEVVVYDNKGNKTKVRYPVTRTEVVPAHDVLTLTAEIRFEVVDLQTGKKVLLYTDRRYREPSVFESQTPLKMYERNVKAFFDKFSALVNE